VDDKAERKHLRAEGAADVLRAWLDRLDRLKSEDAFTGENLEKLLKEIAVSLDRKLGKVAQPLRVALTGKDKSPPIHETLLLVGADESCRRIQTALERIQA
jgi:glutamyl-tRNA synthetase